MPNDKDKPLLTGKLKERFIGTFEVGEYPERIIEGFMSAEDVTSVISDVLDEIGINGVVPGSEFKQTIPNSKIVGPAVTVRNRIQKNQPYKEALSLNSKMAEFEGHNLSKPGDILVVEGVQNISNMGGISSTVGKRQGQLGAIVDGAVRDIEHSRSIGYSVWSRSISPITGKWRIETVEVNFPVVICGIKVSPGDLVVADINGVCFIPDERQLEFPPDDN